MLLHTVVFHEHVRIIREAGALQGIPATSVLSGYLQVYHGLYAETASKLKEQQE
jgi:hypothetical protein